MIGTWLVVLLAVTPGLEAETQAWHAQRLQRLTSEDGWLSLVGLHWLEAGAQTAGSAPDRALSFPAGSPAHLGVFSREGSQVSFAPEPGVQVRRDGKPFTGGPLRNDADGEPDTLSVGSVRFYVIQRGDKVGVRVKDAEAPARKAFRGIDRFPVSASWRVEGRFEPAAKEVMLSVPTVLGTVEPMPSPGVVVFTWKGKQHRLSPVLEPGESKWFFIFADETNKTDTYGAGRFLYADPPENGKVTLDFNRAYNPPCAFSKFATCPLPPKANRLPVRVEAGEKRFQH